MTVLWNAADSEQATGGQATAGFAATGVSIDSRTLTRGDLFVALKEPNSDGHEYVEAALKAGACAAVVADTWRGHPTAGPFLIVADPERALGALARAARQRSVARIAAITGSVGKTGCKDALAMVLGRQAETCATQGNLNNHYGLPLSLARLGAEARFGVFELGMNHPGELAPLSALLRPDVALITTVEAVHLEYFDSEEAIADAKAEIFQGMGQQGTAILNRDNHHFGRLYRRAREAGIARITSFGAHERADMRLQDCTLHETSSTVTVLNDGTPLTYTIGVPGRHWVVNSLAVLASAQALGADIAAAATALGEMRPTAGRGLRTEVPLSSGGGFVLIDESYNASPASMQAAFDVLAQATPKPGGRRIAVLGDMLELGENAESLHAGLAADLVASRADLVFTAGPLMARLATALPAPMQGGHTSTSGCLAPRVTAAVRAGDVVMVKGSLGSQMKRVVDALRALDDAGDLPRRVVNGC